MSNLVPKQGVDVNGRNYTRMVRPDEAQTSNSRVRNAAAAPSLATGGRQSSQAAASDHLLSVYNNRRDEYQPEWTQLPDSTFSDEDYDAFAVGEDEYVAVYQADKWMRAVAFSPDGVARLVASGYQYSNGEYEWEQVKQFSEESIEARRISLHRLGRETGILRTGTGYTRQDYGSGPVGYDTFVGDGSKLYRENGSSVGWVAKQTRQHIKDAIRAGLLPGHLNYEVRGNNGAVRITISGNFHEDASSWEDQAWIPTNTNEGGIRDEVRGLAEQYNWSMRDNIGEVNNRSFYVYVDTQRTN